MAKLKSTPRRGRKLSGSSLRRPSRSSRRRSSFDQLGDSLLAWAGPFIWVGTLAAAVVVGYIVVTGETITFSTFRRWLSDFSSALSGAFAAGRDAILETLGFGFIPLFLFAAASFLLVGFQPARTRIFWRRWLGTAGLLVFAFGLLSFIKPGSSVGDVDFRSVTAGGELGQALTSGPLAIVLWLGLLVVSLWLIAPSVMLAGARATPLVFAGIYRGAWWVACVVGGALAAVGGWLNREREDLTDEPEIISYDEPLSIASDDRPAFPATETLEAVDVEFEEHEPDLEEIRAALDQQAKPAEPALRIAVPADDELPEPAPQEAVPWKTPSIGLLAERTNESSARVDNSHRAALIEKTLRSFGVDAKVVQINQGPTVTQFGVEPGWEIKTRAVAEKDSSGKPVVDRDGKPRQRIEEVSRTRVRVNQITALANDLALALAAPTIRIEAPVPGKPVVGIEVPNHTASTVTLRSVIESPAFQRTAGRSKLTLALGQGVSGDPIVADLAKMPHLLIAGSTGSGKSVCINSIIACILMHASPRDVRFVMIDPKRVELAPFGLIPHLAFSNIVTEMDRVVGTLQAVIHEMETRYKKFATIAVRNIDSYNRNPRVTTPLPYWVVIVDELADLMMAAPYEVERQICRLAQLARATGIHLLVATQRPSVDVVTGLIKANFPTRIAFAMSSQVDSRTILDMGGAERLLGKGDMLYMPTDAAKPKRIQGVFVSDQEIEKLVAFWAAQKLKNPRPDTYDHLLEEAKEALEHEASADPVMEQARELAGEHKRISTSLLQRRLRIGYPRAARIMDQLEAEGIVGPSEGAGSREVLSGELEPEEASFY
jgi:S-DNA-T family DNA segregation ATPase FtsK/SpoIIIE